MSAICDMMVCNSPKEWTLKFIVQCTMQSAVLVLSQSMETCKTLVIPLIMSLNR